MTIIEKNINNPSAPQLKSHIDHSPENHSLVINLEQVDVLDSSGLGFLAGRTLKKKISGSILKLANLNERIKMVVDVTKAYMLFDIYGDVAAAAI